MYNTEINPQIYRDSDPFSFCQLPAQVFSSVIKAWHKWLWVTVTYCLWAQTALCHWGPVEVQASLTGPLWAWCYPLFHCAGHCHWHSPTEKKINFNISLFRFCEYICYTVKSAPCSCGSSVWWLQLQFSWNKYIFVIWRITLFRYVVPRRRKQQTNRPNHSEDAHSLRDKTESLLACSVGTVSKTLVRKTKKKMLGC